MVSVVVSVVVVAALGACSKGGPNAGPTGGTGTATGPGNPTAGANVADNSADRLVFWVKCADVNGLTDAQLDEWKQRGVDGFVCALRHLSGMGDNQEYTADPNADLSAPQYDALESLHQSNIAKRAAARGMKLYLGFYLVNLYNPRTPLRDWFDDEGWSNLVVPKLRDAAAAARLLGFAGLAFDQELYPQEGGASTATWSWDHPGNTHSEPEVRAKARQRGAELMAGILSGFPEVEIMAYATYLPETWDALVQKDVNGIKDAYRSSLQLDFLDGITSVEGYGAIRLINATFYKTPHLSRATWDNALQYHQNRFYSLMSRRLSNWSYASTRLFESPFAWVDKGSTDFEKAYPPQYVAEQLAAFSRWGTGREFANFAYAGLSGFDYRPYEEAMRAASAPAVVDRELPTLSVSTPDRDQTSQPGRTIMLAGTAKDNFAVRSVRWQNDRGGAGAAPMTWDLHSGDQGTGWRWDMEWSVKDLALQPGLNRITVTVEDIKGLVTTRTLLVTAGG